MKKIKLNKKPNSIIIMLWFFLGVIFLVFIGTMSLMIVNQTKTINHQTLVRKAEINKKIASKYFASKNYFQDFKITRSEDKTKVNFEVTNNSNTLEEFVKNTNYYYIGVFQITEGWGPSLLSNFDENGKWITGYYPGKKFYGGAKGIIESKSKVTSLKLTDKIFGNYTIENLDSNKDYFAFIYGNFEDQGFTKDVLDKLFGGDMIVLENLLLEKTK